MNLALTTIFYSFLFLSVYVQVFLLVTFLENRRKILVRQGNIRLKHYPTVTIIVPAWNEERTVYKTIRSIFALNYPKNKLEIFLIDDGSTDGTWNIISKFKKYKNVRVFRKANGGKHSALNLGLKHLQTEFLACLDADSYADKESLIRLMSYFEKDPEIMAVCPSLIASEPKKIIQKAQKFEFHMGIYIKKMLGFLGAINVTPGPLTVFRRKVFDTLGPYKKAYNTEDMEIAYRMQKYRYKIAHCNDALVYTTVPSTVKKLYRQRLRWIYGFINNTLDYRDVLFKRKYGNFALFTLPTGVISMFAVGYAFGRMIYNAGNFIYDKYIHWETVGIENGANFQFDPFFINTKISIFLVLMIYSIIIFAMIFGGKMYDGKIKLSWSMFFFFPIFLILSPLWILKALFNTIFSRTPAWR